MDHADYQKRYDRPYPEDHLEKWTRMAKQMVDARHVANDSGVYIGGAASDFRHNAAGGVEVGVTNYSKPWLSSKVALAGQLNSGASNGFVGVNSALHVSTPTRVAPFVGAGLFGGVDVSTVLNTLNDEESTDTQFLGAVYPEAGVHVWLNGRTRLSGSASYWVTSTGRDKDFWYYGLGLTIGFGPDAKTIDTGRVVREEDYVNRILDGRADRMTREADARLKASEADVTLAAGLQEVASDEQDDRSSKEGQVQAADIERDGVLVKQLPELSADHPTLDAIVVPEPPSDIEGELLEPLILPSPPRGRPLSSK